MAGLENGPLEDVFPISNLGSHQSLAMWGSSTEWSGKQKPTLSNNWSVDHLGPLKQRRRRVACEGWVSPWIYEKWFQVTRDMFVWRGKNYKEHTPCHVIWKLVIANPPLLPTWKKRCFSIEDYRLTIERFACIFFRKILILNTNTTVTCLQLFQEWSPWRAVIQTQNTWRQKRLDLMQNCWNFYRWLKFKPLWRSMKSCLVHKYPCNSFYTPWTNVFRPWKEAINPKSGNDPIPNHPFLAANLLASFRG